MSSSFVSNSVFATITGLCLTFSSFMASVITARLLGVEETGLVAYAVWVIATVVIIGDLGITVSLARYLPELMVQEDEENSRRLTSFLFRPFVLSAVIAPASIIPFAAWSIPNSGESTPVFWMLAGACCLAQSLAAFGIGYLQATGQFRQAAARALISFVVLLVSLTAGSVLFGPTGTILGYLAANLVSATACVSLRGSQPNISPPLRNRVIKYARYNWMTAIVVAFVYSRLELLFLQQFSGSRATALFSVGLALSSLATQGPLLLTRGVFYYFAERLGAADHSAVRDAMQTGTRMLAFLIFPVCLGTVAIMPQLLPLIYGAPFAEAIPAASVLVCAAGLVTSQAMISNLLLASERNAFIFWNGVLGAAVATIFGFTLIPWFGLMGAAYGRAVLQLGLFCSGAWYVTKVLGIPLPFGNVLRLLLAASISAIAARCITAIAPEPRILPAAILVGAIVYVVAVRVLSALDRQDMERLQRIVPSRPASFRLLVSLITNTVCRSRVA